MKNLFFVSLLTLFGHCAMAQTPSDGRLNDYGLLSQKAKVVRQAKYNLKKALPVKDEEIIKDKPAGEEVEEIQRKSVCAVPDNGSASFSRQTCALATYILGEDKHLYLFNALGKCYTFSYTKLDADGEGKYTLHTPQAIDMGYNDNGEKIKLYATRLVLAQEGDDWVYVPEFDSSEKFKGDVHFTLTDGVLAQEDEGTNPEVELPNVIIGLTDSDGQWQGFATSNILIRPFKEEKTEFPEELEPENFTLTYTDVRGNSKEENIKVALTETEAYVLCPYTFSGEDNDALWLKGEIKGNNITFKTQYMGIAEDEHAYVFLLPATCSFRTDEEGQKHMQAEKADEIVFSYDKAAKKLVSAPNGLMLINEGGETISPWAAYGEPTIKMYDMTLRKPAAPTIKEVTPYDESDGMSVKFMMETKDVDGKYIMPDYLYYNVYFDTDEKPMTFTEEAYSGLDEDMTDIPYLFEDKQFFYFQGDMHLFYALVENYKKVGVQVLHKIGNEVSRSEIVWANNPSTKITDIDADAKIVKTTFFDLSGRRMATCEKGIFIKEVTYSNGKKTTTKVVR